MFLLLKKTHYTNLASVPYLLNKHSKVIKVISKNQPHPKRSGLPVWFGRTNISPGRHPKKEKISHDTNILFLRDKLLIYSSIVKA
jgi:hypothetical protein